LHDEQLCPAPDKAERAIAFPRIRHPVRDDAEDTDRQECLHAI